MRLRALFKCHGGKFFVAPWVVDHFPSDYENMTYIEGCCGACNVLLRKNPSKIEIINDIDQDVYNLFHCLKYNPEFIETVKSISYEKEVFENHLKMKAISPIERGIKELVTRRMSRGGLQKHFSWSERQRGGRAGDLNSWENFKENLPLLYERIKNVELRNTHVFDLLDEFSEQNCLFYIDPPYVPESRTVKKAYNFEMTEKDHIELSKRLKNVKGKVLLSGYYSKLYCDLYKEWNVDFKEVANHSSQAKKKQRRLECLWTNY